MLACRTAAGAQHLVAKPHVKKGDDASSVVKTFQGTVFRSGSPVAVRVHVTNQSHQLED